MSADTDKTAIEFRDVERGRALADALHRAIEESGRERITVMHVCGSHEQAIARYGLRDLFPQRLEVIMGPGCPVCITDAAEVDEAVNLARQGIRILTYGDMLRVPGSVMSLADAKRDGADVGVVYGVAEAAAQAAVSADPVVFFATGFETTAVATAAVLLADPPSNFHVLSAHKYIPPVMEIVAEMPGSRIEGFLAAGHAATITGWGIFDDFVAEHDRPVAVAGFEPLDILAALYRLVELVARGESRTINMYPRCVTRQGNLPAQDKLWRVFRASGGRWRGIALVPNGNLRLRKEFAEHDARERFDTDFADARVGATTGLSEQCRCGDIMSGIATPADCVLFERECTPESPVGACMVSSEGTCRIWQQYGNQNVFGACPTAAKA
jgi:hydrogenase expression/formation protein HypD